MTAPKSDPLFWPVLNGMLSCLVQELALTPAGSVQHARVTPGDSVIASLTTTVNECCEGIASVRLVRFFPTDQFPQEATRPATEGGVTSWALELELQVVRCTASPGADMAPSDEVLSGGAMMATDDWAAMRRAACCQYETGSNGVLDYMVGAGLPTTAEGGCIGATLTVTLQVECAECGGDATW